MDRDHDGSDPVSQSCGLNPRLEKTFESLDRGLARGGLGLQPKPPFCVLFALRTLNGPSTLAHIKVICTYQFYAYCTCTFLMLCSYRIWLLNRYGRILNLS
jgi:hypothetical protein